MTQPRPPQPRSPLSDRPAASTIAAANTVDILILDFLEWIGRDPRPYAEVLEVWRTSCPRFPVWEDASDRGLIVCRRTPGRGTLVGLSAAGGEHLRKHRPSSCATPDAAIVAETTASG